MKNNKKSNFAEYNAQYKKDHYRRINLTMKFDLYDELLDHTLETGEPVNAFIRRAIEEAIQRDKDKRYKL